MLQITPQMKILVAVDAVDFRKGIDGLVQLCKASLHQDPFVGAVFVFRNRRSTVCFRQACEKMFVGPDAWQGCVAGRANRYWWG